MSFLLRASLALNALLLLLAGARLMWPSPDRAPGPTSVATDTGDTTGLGNKGLVEARPPSNAEPNGRAGWDWIESRDHRQLIANLRKVGCPEETIQEIVCLRLCRAMRQRLLQATAEQQRSVPYWKAPPQSQVRENIASRQRLNDELDAALEQLFGQDGRAVRFRVAGLSNIYPTDAEYLPPDKASQVRDIERRYRQFAAEFTDATLPFGFTDPDAEAARKDLERQKLADLRRVLTPQEYELYLFRASAAADYVRKNLPEAQSEEDFKRMVKVAVEFEMDGSHSNAAARWGIQDDEDDLAAQARKEREEAFQLRLTQELGSDRLAAQKEADAAREREERDTSSRRASIARITEVGATEEEAGKFVDRLMALQPRLHERAKETMGDNPTPEQRKAFEAVLKAELEQAAMEIMGADKARALIEKMERD